MVDLDNHLDYHKYYLSRIAKAKRAGDQLLGLCPFHDDKSQSFSVDTVTGKWKCFAGCGSGNAISFHARLLKSSTKEAYRDLCRLTGAKPKEKEQKQNGHGEKRDRSKTIPLEYLDLFREMPEKVLDYLQEKRGWSLDVIQKYRIGYNSKLRFIPGNIGPDRITIPVFDEFGEMVNIRTYQPGAAQNKLMSWSTGSKKRGNRYGFGEGRLWPISILERARSKGAIVYLVEGEPDCLCGLSQGLHCITSTFGADNWKDEWNPLFKGLHVRLAYDNDEAGRKGMARICEHLPSFAGKVETIRWPEWMGEKEDLTDWFVKYRRTTADLDALPWTVVDRVQPTSLKKEGTKKTQAQRLIELTADAILFHSPDDGRFAIVHVDEHREVWPIRGKGFRDWLSHRFYLDQGKPLGTQALQDSIRLLEAKARFEGEKYRTYVRVGEHDGDLYLDLCNASWEVVQITPDAWRIMRDPPVKFLRTKSMLPLPHPERNSSLWELKPFLNVPDDDGFLLICGFLIQSLRPAGPYPILTLEGQQGTAKSHTARILRALVDPSTAMLRTAPRDERDFLIMAHNSWLLAFDNLSGAEPWLSDALCRLSTGGGFSTRELYSDSDEVVFDAQRPQILTGIDRIASRHDLLDRMLVLTLPYIPDHKRRPEAELWQRFESTRPRILGGLLDAVVAALANFSTTKMDNFPRLADFAQWVTAAESALPWKPGSILAAYGRNRRDAVELQQFMEGKGEWAGSATDLLERLKELIPDDTRKTKSWPKAANGLTKKLRRIATFLRSSGLELDLDARVAGTGSRFVIIRRGTQETVTTATIVTDPQQSATGQEFDPVAIGFSESLSSPAQPSHPEPSTKRETTSNDAEYF